MKYPMRYKNGSDVRSALSKLKNSDTCSICGEKHFSNKYTVDGDRVCEGCYIRDNNKEFMEDE
jgi:formylmethanofuran dehydrogenase subunit E